MTFRWRKYATAWLLSGSALALAACGTTGSVGPKYAIIKPDGQTSLEAQGVEGRADAPSTATTQPRYAGVDRPIGSTPPGAPYKETAKKPKSSRREASGNLKVGKPYQIKGQWYYPAHQPDYDEKGIASWYGDQFHGRPTASGERFDMHEVSAAHKTLPLNSMVEVTNLENGRSMTMRINDRGPFIDGRIIDLSREAAVRLGMFNAGTAQVRVRMAGNRGREPRIEIAAAEPRGQMHEPQAVSPKQALPPIGGWGAAGLSESNLVATAAASPQQVAVKPAGPAPTTPRLGFPPPPVQQAAITQASLPPLAAEQAPIQQAAIQHVSLQQAAFQQSATGAPAARGHFEVQAGLFAVRANADRAASLIKGAGDVEIRASEADGTPVYRVLVRAIPDAMQAIRVREQVADAGFPDARVLSRF